MYKILLFAFIGLVASDSPPALLNGYGAPNGAPSGASNGASNGANGNVIANGYSAPESVFNGGNGNGNGLVNGNGLTNGNSYSAPANGGSGINGNDLNGNGINGNGINGNGAANGYSSGNGNGQSNGPSPAYGAPGADELAELADSLPGGGVPGEDFPVLSEVPDTGFKCGDQAVSGYYADVDDAARCQVFHICQLRESGQVQQDSFICPNGTIFNQQYLVCDWWFNFVCSTAEGFYSVNELIGKDSTTQYNLDQASSSANFAFGAAGANGMNGFQERPGFNVNGAFGSNLGQTVSGGGNFDSSGYTSGNAFGTGGGAAGGNGQRPGPGNGRRLGISNGGGRRSGGNRPSGGRGGAGGNGRGYSY